MSLKGVIRFRGRRCDVYRPTLVEGTGGLPTLTWPTEPVVRDGRVFLDVISDELAQRLFGRETRIDIRGTVLPTTAAVKDDGVVVREGEYAGVRFRVTGIAPQTARVGAAHLELALERTTEVFG